MSCAKRNTRCLFEENSVTMSKYLVKSYHSHLFNHCKDHRDTMLLSRLILFLSFTATGVTAASSIFDRLPSAPKIPNVGSITGEEKTKDTLNKYFDSTMALRISSLAIFGYALESAYPQYFADKYSLTKKYEGNGKFWEGWFGTEMLKEAIILYTGARYGDEKTKKNLCIASAANWVISLIRSHMTKSEFDEKAYKMNQAIMGALALICLAGSGELRGN